MAQTKVQVCAHHIQGCDQADASMVVAALADAVLFAAGASLHVLSKAELDVF